MAKNRRIPFGYQMINGEITTHPREVYAVSKIFAEYLKGRSLLDISKEIQAENIPYHPGDDCQWNKNMVVLCKSISRFARNTVDTLEYVRQLKDLGIGVIFEKENINTLTMNSEFMIALYGSFAQAELESISKNVSWGVEKAFRDGKVRYSYNNLYGYRKGADGKPEIIPEEAEVVRLIYKLYLDGLTLRQIAQHLKNLNIPKREYAEWTINGIHSILSNEKYVGDALLQKTYTVDCITHKSVKNNGERAKYLVTDAHDAIVDRDTLTSFNKNLRADHQCEKRATKHCHSKAGIQANML